MRRLLGPALAVVLTLALVTAAALAGWWTSREDGSTVAADVSRIATADPAAPADAGSSSGTSPSADAASATRAAEGSRSRPSAPPTAKLLMEVVQAPEVGKYSEEEWKDVLAQREAEEAAAAAAELAGSTLLAGGGVTLRVATFNVLGSQHTVPGGPRNPPYPTAAVRTPRAIGKIREHGVHVIGLQELKRDQHDQIRGATGFASYFHHETDNAIMWNPAVFDFVSGDHYIIRFMNGDRPQTIVRLRHKASGREMYFVNTHVSTRWRPESHAAGHYALIDQVNRLKSAGIPIFVMGDMNNREAFFCRVAPATGLVASIGGNTDGGCNPARGLAVDWVMGWGGVSWSDYWEDRSTLRRISDHHFVSATATVAPQ